MNKERVAELRIEALNAKYAGKEFTIPAGETMEILNLAMNQLEPSVTPEMWRNLGRMEALAERSTADVSALTNLQAWDIIQEVQGLQIMSNRNTSAIVIETASEAGDVARAILATAPAPIQQSCCGHDSDCAIHNAGCPELLGPCNCSLSAAEPSPSVAVDLVTLSMETIVEAAKQSGFERSASCCMQPLKFCAGDEWEGNLEGFAKALLRLFTPPTPAVSQSQAAGDAVDAAMFRWLCQRDVTVESIGFVCYAPELGHDGSNLRAQVAAAMREQP